MSKRSSLDGPMGRDGKFQSISSSMFLKPDVTSLLPYHDSFVFLQNANHLVVGKTRDDAHTASSMTSEFAGTT
jgi:hypothetical protein